MTNWKHNCKSKAQQQQNHKTQLQIGKDDRKTKTQLQTKKQYCKKKKLNHKKQKTRLQKEKNATAKGKNTTKISLKTINLDR